MSFPAKKLWFPWRKWPGIFYYYRLHILNEIEMGMTTLFNFNLAQDPTQTSQQMPPTTDLASLAQHWSHRLQFTQVCCNRWFVSHRFINRNNFYLPPCRRPGTGDIKMPSSPPPPPPMDRFVTFSFGTVTQIYDVFMYFLETLQLHV